jgi:hypothetical protein
VLLKNIAIHGDMAIATSRTCQELMNGPPKPGKAGTALRATLEDADVNLAERQFGAGANSLHIYTCSVKSTFLQPSS